MNLRELYSDFYRPSHILLRGLFATIVLLLAALSYGWFTGRSGFALVGVAFLVPVVLTMFSLLAVWLRSRSAAPPSKPPHGPVA